MLFFSSPLLYCSILLQALKYREKQHSMCLFFFLLLKPTFIIANLFLLCCVAGDRYQAKKKVSPSNNGFPFPSELQIENSYLQPQLTRRRKEMKTDI